MLELEAARQVTGRGIAAEMQGRARYPSHLVADAGRARIACGAAAPNLARLSVQRGNGTRNVRKVTPTVQNPIGGEHENNTS